MKKLFTILITIILSVFLVDADLKANKKDVQILKRSLDAEPDSLHIAKSCDVLSYFIMRDLYEGLILCNQDGKIIPGNAEKWDIEDDGKLYRFHLRKDIKWSNGDKLTAHDFVFAWQHVLDPKTASTYAFIHYPILNAEQINKGKIIDLSQLGVKAIDDHILEVKLKATTPYFLNALLHPSFFPFHKASYEKFGDSDFIKPGNLISNGAFVLSDRRFNEYITLSKNLHYWDREHVKLDKVQYYPIEDANTILKKYRANELDLTFTLSSDRFKQVKEDSKLSKDLKTQPYLTTFYYGINLAKEPLGKSKKVREALSLVIDREILSAKIIAAGEIPAYGFVPPNTANARPQSVAFKDTPMNDRIERAKALYKEAGYSEKRPLNITFSFETNENYKKIAVAVVNMWKQYLPGIQVTLHNMESKVFLQERFEKKNFEICGAGWIGDYNDPYTFLETLISNTGLNDLAYSSLTYDNLMKKASMTNNLDERAILMGNAEKMLLDKHALIPLYHAVRSRLVKPYIKGYEMTSNNVLDIFYSKDLEIIR
ncbi:MAG: peptide ABC transporter substrate-binding protein [Alphaproteobacteria bacterium]|nr:peptide ABC transporter substrate-binding protein [Alphaproteobacteria bacterium]